MHTIVVDENGCMHTSVFEPIIQKSNLVNSLKILIPRYYNEFDMHDFTAMLEYKTPEQSKVGIVDLEDNVILENGYIQYIVPVDIKMTSEAGFLKIMMVFTQSDEDGKLLFVRRVGPADVFIKDIGEWEGEDPDGELDSIDQKIAEMQEMIDELKTSQKELDDSKADNISYEDNIIQLLSNGKSIGDSYEIQGQNLTWQEI